MRDDQANGLRRLFGRRARHTIAICGNDGATVAVNVASALARSGLSVVVLDRSLGDAARAVGQRARYDLGHVLDGDRSLEEVLLQGPAGVAVLSAARGLDRLATTSADWQSALEAALPALAANFDVWLINGLLPGNAPAAPMLIAINTSPQAITNAYGHIKALSRAQGRRDFGVVVYAASTPSAAQQVYDCVAETARRFLSARLDFVGCVPAGVPGAQASASDETSPTATAFAGIAAKLIAGMSSGPLLASAS